MTNTTLKPCPFCGSETEVCEGGINGKMRVYGLVEHKDGCFFLADGLSVKYQHIMESEFAAWNKRAATTIGKVQVEIEPALRGMLTAEQVREAIEANSWAETSSIREFNDSSWQAIADELNRRAERTCRNVDEHAGAGFFTCGACGFGRNGIELTPNYCPACGAKVEDERGGR